MRWNPLTADEEATVWQRWRSGVSQRAIARALGRPPGTVYHLIRAAGGLPPRPRRRAARTLTLAEREEIACGVAAGRSLRALSRQLGRAPSTLSREVRRHGGRTTYRASRADAAAWQRARRPQRCRLARQPRLGRLVARRLAQCWSPEQIAGWLRRTYADRRMHVSHETIYRTLFVQSRGALRATLQTQLRRGGRFADRDAAPRRAAGRLSTRCPSASARPRSRIARSRATGKAICSSGRGTRALRRWSSGSRAMSSSCSWRIGKPRRWCRP